jgi:hypothetical protein
MKYENLFEHLFEHKNIFYRFFKCLGTGKILLNGDTVPDGGFLT